MKVSKAAVIDTASQIADEHGLHNVSLKVIAEKLCVKTPSLYNHIDNLDSTNIIRRRQYREIYQEPFPSEDYPDGILKDELFERLIMEYQYWIVRE